MAGKKRRSPGSMPKKPVVYPTKLPLNMEIDAIECPVCADIVWSRYTHDMRYCRCGYCFIDGGRSYTRWGFGNENVTRPWPIPQFLVLLAKPVERI